MKKITLISAFFTLIIMADAQLAPNITSWIINTTGQTGYDGLLTNVQTVQYSDSSVYVSSTCIPGYDIGPWQGDPNVPLNQNFVFQIPRYPRQNTSTQTAVGLGHIGVWSNGVSIFNSQDANSYNNQGVWLQNAYHFEYVSFDSCLGHAQQQGEYHHHVSPRCLYDVTDSAHHSPIIGFAWDGYPIYGAYGYANVNGTGGIKRMRSSYQLRNITVRDTLPDGTAASQSGPAVSSTYPLGSYIEDYNYISGSGDLDDHNGRFCITPDYPNGTYAYFVTVDSTLTPAYPYTLGLTYYGVVPTYNVGPGSGHATISEATTVYSPATGINETNKEIKFQLMPNPTKDYAYIYFEPASDNNITGTLYNTRGQLLKTINNMQPSISYALNLSGYPSGTYFLHLETSNTSMVQKIVKVK